VSARTVTFHKYTIMEHPGPKTSAELVHMPREWNVEKAQLASVRANTVSFASIGGFQKRLEMAP
jgi:hypothetical protein